MGGGGFLHYRERENGTVSAAFFDTFFGGGIKCEKRGKEGLLVS